MKLTLLGTGVPAPSAKRAGSGHVVQIAGDTFVFDHGPGAHARMLQAGIPVTDVTQLFLTHFHYDHFTDVASLVLRRWDQGAGRIADLPVYGPQPAGRIFALLFGEDGVYAGDIDARTQNASSVALYHARGGTGARSRPRPRVTELQHGSTVEGSGWTVRAVETPHTQPQLISLAYRLDCDEGSLVYSGDTGPCDALVELAQGADILIHMCHYVSGTEYNQAMSWGTAGHRHAADHAQRAGVGTLVLTHMTRQVDTDGVRERIVKEIAEIYGGRIIVGEDLKTIGTQALEISDPL